MDLNIFADIFVFLFGLCIGSFLNCAIYRLEEKKSMQGRSFCPNCRHDLSWLDLFPVFSWIFLGGKCRYCHKKISIQYPLVEIFTAFLFLVIFLNTPVSNAVYFCLILCFLIIIFIFDLKHYIIPDMILFPAILISLTYDLFDFSHILNYLLAAAVACGFFLIIFLISKGKWMGFGDVKLAILMGLLLGLPNVLAALFLAFFFGAIIGVILIATQKKGFRSEIPFGPFLIAGTFFAMLFGNQIVQWYLNQF
jgi:prepilin signal peptidase PulO-like enzyme (type II secretory pathway)